MSREAVVHTAVRLLDSGGIPSLALRRLAGELGVQQSALYWHFRNKQEILAAVADEILAPAPVAAGRGWRARVTSVVDQVRGQLLAHTDGAELVSTAFAMRLGGGAPLAQFVAELQAAGCGPADAAAGGSVLWQFLLGHTMSEQQWTQAARLGAVVPDRAAETPPFEVQFRDGTAVILDGIARRV